MMSWPFVCDNLALSPLLFSDSHDIHTFNKRLHPFQKVYHENFMIKLLLVVTHTHTLTPVVIQQQHSMSYYVLHFPYYSVVMCFMPPLTLVFMGVNVCTKLRDYTFYWKDVINYYCVRRSRDFLFVLLSG